MIIYRIKIVNEKVPYFDILEKITRIGNYCYSDRSFFVFTDIDMEDVQKKVCDFGIVEKVKYPKDTSQCSELVRNWCNKQVYEETIHNFENSAEGQKKMRQIIDYLNKIKKTQKGGELDAE